MMDFMVIRPKAKLGLLVFFEITLNLGTDLYNKQMLNVCSRPINSGFKEWLVSCYLLVSYGGEAYLKYLIGQLVFRNLSFAQ